MPGAEARAGALDPGGPRRSGWRARSLGAACGVLLAACGAGRSGGGPSAADSPPAEALAGFAAAVQAGRFDRAWALLSARWRARSTPTALAADWSAAGSVARGAAERALAALSAGARPAVDGPRATLPTGEGRAAVLLLEDGAWRVDALE